MVDLAAMKASKLRYYDLAVKTTEVTALRLRGEEPRARALEEEIETEVVQLGSWSIDIQIPLSAAPAYGVCRDILGLERCIDALENVVMIEYGGVALAETYLAQGRLSEARTRALRAFELAEHPDSRQAIPRLRALRCLGLIEAAAGNELDAIEHLERAVAAAEDMQCPSVAGSMHEARARVALMHGDAGAYRTHCRKTERWLRSTRNPVLIALAERLVEAGVSHEGAGLRTTTSVADAVTVASNTTVDSSRSWSELRPQPPAGPPMREAD